MVTWGERRQAMKTKEMLTVTVAAILLLAVTTNALGDRQLDRAEVLQIFQQLTSQPEKTWIPAGIIEATHEEYRAPKTTGVSNIDSIITQEIAEYQNNPVKREMTENLQKAKLDAIPFNVRYEMLNEYTMTSAVTVRFDGDRFYWEINVNSRTDSVKPDENLAGNFMTDQFNLDWNARRVFAWDGKKYTNYFLPGNSAIIDAAGNTPHVVNGPLTAGIVPWGYGHYSYDSLAAQESTAVEKNIDGQTQTHLTVNLNGSQMLFVLDPAKNYAVLSCSIQTDNAVISKEYHDYQLVSGNWVPRIILLERFETNSNRLLARDLWEIITIDGNLPPADSFDVEYETDALIEYASDVTDKLAMYRHSESADTDALLDERLKFAANEAVVPQNCATAALKYTTGRLGKEVSDQQLAELVTDPDTGTSLYAMKQFAEGLGLQCRAVTTDIDTLRNVVGPCQVILHIPGKKHFVVLESIDNGYVRIIDFTENKFYYRTDIAFFGMDWTEGTALLISDAPIEIEGEFIEISDHDELNNITGGYWQCNVLLQEYDVIYCLYLGGLCDGWYYEFYERWGCGTAASGSCSTSVMIRYKKSICVNDLYEFGHCDITGDWTVYYMRACA